MWRTDYQTDYQTDYEKGNIYKVVLAIQEATLKLSEIGEMIGLKHSGTIRDTYINPAIEEGYVTYLYPENPKRKGQAYYLTEKGLAKLRELKE